MGVASQFTKYFRHGLAATLAISRRLACTLGASDGRCATTNARVFEDGRGVEASVDLFVLLDWFVSCFICGEFCLVDHFEKERP